MIWTRKSKYHVESDCGRYTVCKVFAPGGSRYETWRDARGKQAEFLGAADDPQAAQAIAEADAKKQEQGA